MLSAERGHGHRRRRPPPLPEQRPEASRDLIALPAAGVLVALGLINLAALNGRDLIDHQIIPVAAGLALFLVLRRFRAASLPWLGWACYSVSVLLLLAVEVAGTSEFGARRWIAVGSFTLQPSELAKLGLVLVLAQVLGRDRPWYQRLPLALLVAAVPVALVVTEPDLSTATVLAALTLVMLVIGRIPLRVIGALAVAVVVVAPFAERLLHPYQLQRVHAFLAGSTGPNGAGWTITQAHIALAWGGLSGQAHQPMHLLLADYLPARETDLAFTSLIEQWGIRAGVLAVLAAAALIWRMAAASRHARTRGAALSAAGFAALLGIEVTVSVAGNLGLIPTAGVPFPLISYGGTAAAVHIALIGLVLGISAEAKRCQLWLAPRSRRVHPRLVRLTAVAVTCALVGMVGFVWHLQHARGPSLRAAGLTQMTRCIDVPAPRGEITDRHGVPLAINIPQDQIWVVPALLPHSDVSRLAALTARPVSELRRQLDANGDSLTVDVATLPASAGARVTAAHLSGVMVVSAPKRYYPYGPLLGPILGWTGIATAADMKKWPDLPPGATVGRAGIEQQYDPIIRGVDGQQCFYVEPSGTPDAMGPSRAPIPGANLRLSIDIGLQQSLTAALAAGLRGSPGQRGGDLGAAVMLDPRNGQVLAMASLPSYDDNVYGPPIDQSGMNALANTPGYPQLEHATQVVAPPGSTFKLVVAAADVQGHPAIPPNQVIPTGGAWTLDGFTFHNWEDLPPQNLVQAIGWSNDVYFYQLAWALGADRIAATARQLDVGQPTGIDLPGESSGYLGTPETIGKIGATWYPGSTVDLGIGQGYLDVTPLQDAVWTSAVATGSLVTPHVGLAFGSRGLSPVTTDAPRPLPFAASLGPVRAGMRLAVTGGTALALGTLPAPVAGKTGTAQDPSALGGTDSWLSAVAPAGAPTVEATAYVHGGLGHDTSTAIVRAALAYYLAHEKAITGG